MKHKKNKIKIKFTRNLTRSWDRETYLKVKALLEEIHLNFKIFGKNLSLTNNRLGIISGDIDLIKEDVSEIKNRKFSSGSRKTPKSKQIILQKKQRKK